MGATKSAKATAKAKAAMLKKEKKEDERARSLLKEQAKRAQEVAADQNLRELTVFLKANPEATSAILAQVRAGSWDAGSNSEGEEEKLPAYQNKISLLSKDNTVELVRSFHPGLARFMTGLPRKTPKGELGAILAYVVHMDLGSAVPTKKMGPLKAYLQDRWSRNGQRCLNFWSNQPDGVSSVLEACRQEVLFY